MGELGVERLAVAQLSEQPLGHLAQLLGAQIIQGLQLRQHGRHVCQGRPCAVMRRSTDCTPASDHGDDAGVAHALPRQAQQQGLELRGLELPLFIARSRPDELALVQAASRQPDGGAEGSLLRPDTGSDATRSMGMNAGAGAPSLSTGAPGR